MSTVNNSRQTDPSYWFFIAAILGLLFIYLISSCNNDEQQISTQPFNAMEYSIDYTVPVMPVQASITPCDSVYYEPVAYGAELRILKNTISSGSRRGLPWWQCKSFAWQLIGPTKYQQDSTKERVVFADIDTIGYGDTFYICRKKHL